jgi:hypothetical protein
LRKVLRSNSGTLKHPRAKLYGTAFARNLALIDTTVPGSFTENLFLWKPVTTVRVVRPFKNILFFHTGNKQLWLNAIL